MRQSILLTPYTRSTRPNQLSAGCVRARTRRSKPPQVAAGSTSMAPVCLENFDVPFVEPVTVDGDSAVQLLAKIEANNPSKSLVHVIWDNAAYHRCAAVKKWLSRPKCRIHLIQLPTYCPHLNPIERLWAVLHAHVTHNRFYPTQKQFANAILHFLRNTIPKKWTGFPKSGLRQLSHHLSPKLSGFGVREV